MSDSVRVLLVEDDPAVLLGTQQTLQLAGFEVEPFADAEAAIPSILCSTWQAHPQTFSFRERRVPARNSLPQSASTQSTQLEAGRRRQLR